MSGAPAIPPPERAGEHLKREITRPLLLIFVIGDVLGGGIYALVGEVGGRVGGAIWAAFLAALILAAFTAFSYAELITKYPRAGGAGLFVNRAFRSPPVSFLVTFAVALSGITSAATLVRGFGGGYLTAFVDVEVLVGAVALLVLVGIVNFIGIKESVRLNFGFTAVELAGLLLSGTLAGDPLRKGLQVQAKVEAGKLLIEIAAPEKDAVPLGPLRISWATRDTAAAPHHETFPGPPPGGTPLRHTIELPEGTDSAAVAVVVQAVGSEAAWSARIGQLKP